MSRRNRREPWRNDERHYCAACNAWMGSDRQSILLHENGKKHKENVERTLQEKRDKKAEEERQRRTLQASLRQMEAAALSSHMQHDRNMLAASILSGPLTNMPAGFGPAPVVSSLTPVSAQTPPPPPPPPPPPSQSSGPKNGSSKKEWETRKKKRQEDKMKKDPDGDEEDEDEIANGQPLKKRVKIGPNEGHYKYDTSSQVYLEGGFFYGILEEDLPIQFWIGPGSSTPAERRLVGSAHLWVGALVASIQTRPSASVGADQDPCLVSVSYLATPSDQDETIATKVPLDRIRILLGADDQRIPKTLDEARILAMGGEEVEVAKEGGLTQAEIDEATGLSGWSTVTVKRSTVLLEEKEARARERAKKQREAKEKELKDKEAQARKMEEAKFANADDSALGAYDVWGTGGYKGVDIRQDVALSAQDTAKNLASGKSSVAFKKTKKRAGGNKRGRRTTSADDD